MNWAERIISLHPALITAAFLLITGLGAAITELLPIGSIGAWIAFALSALLSISSMLIWVAALHKVANSRLSADPEKLRKESAVFRNGIIWTIAWLALGLSLPRLPLQFFAIHSLGTLIVGYFWLRAVWITTKALLDFECSDEGFWTFVQILYFPVGVWYLQPRLQRLISAPTLAAASPA